MNTIKQNQTTYDKATMYGVLFFLGFVGISFGINYLIIHLILKQTILMAFFCTPITLFSLLFLFFSLDRVQKWLNN